MKNEAFAPTPELLAKMDAWWRAANYLSACQLYLLDDPLPGFVEEFESQLPQPFAQPFP